MGCGESGGQYVLKSLAGISGRYSFSVHAGSTICPIFALHRLFSNDILEWTEENCRTGALGCVECKGNLADRIVEYYRPFRARRAELERSPGLVGEVLSNGAAKVRPVVEATTAAVREAVHLR